MTGRFMFHLVQTTPSRFLSALTCVAFAMQVCVVCAYALQIELKGHARVDARQAVVLGDIATIEGDGVRAERAGAVVVIDDVLAQADGASYVELTASDVRAALGLAGIPTGRIAVTGDVCVVRVRSVPIETPRDDEPVARETVDEAEFMVVEPAETPTVRAQCAVMLASVLGVPTGCVRMRFDARDDAFLDTPRWSQRVIVEPTRALRSGGSSRTMIDVRIYAGDRIYESKTIRADVEVLREVVIADRRIGRGETIQTPDLRTEERWVPAGGRPLVGSIDEASGNTAATRIEAGDLVRTGDVEAPIVVRRGDSVQAVAVVGGIEVRTQARALEDGRAGDYIECKINGAQHAFVGRVDASGVVIARTDQHAEPTDRTTEHAQ